MSFFNGSSRGFKMRAIVNINIFLGMALVVAGLAAIRNPDLLFSRPLAISALEPLDNIIDYSQTGIAIAGGLLFYLIVAIFAHQNYDADTEASAFQVKEMIHTELSSILLSLSSLALVVSITLIWAGLHTKGFQTLLVWLIALLLSYIMRPKSNDPGQDGA